MGYSTEFKGELKFNRDLTGSQLARVKQFFEEDCRDHPEWGNDKLYYVDLEFNDDYSGVRWNGAEKTYGMPDVVNMITRIMRQEYPDFKFKGKLLAQGEDIEDRWELVISDQGLAERRDIVVSGDKVTCPHCGEEFIYEGSE